MKEPLPLYHTITGRLGITLLCFVIVMLFLSDQSQRVAQGQTGTVTVSARVNRAADDVEERIADGVMYSNSTDLEVGDDPETLGDQAVGLRFRNLAIRRSGYASPMCRSHGAPTSVRQASNLKWMKPTAAPPP